MKVLFVSPFPARPLYGGAVVRIHHLVHGLVQKHALTWACRAPQAFDAPCPVVLNSTRHWQQIFNPLYVGRCLPYARQADIIVVSSIISGLHAMLLHLLSGRPLVYDAHNVEHLLMRRRGNPCWPLMALFEKTLCSLSRHVWTVSDTDAGLLSETLGVPRTKVQTVANGVEMASVNVPPWPRQELVCGTDDLLLLFYGVLGYGPNADAVSVIRAEIVPRLQRRGIPFTMLIGGAGEAPRLAGRIRYLGFVDDLYGLIRTADVLIVPLLTGSGTRMKILEAVACGTPVVSTTAGAEGLEIDEVITTDDWDAFVDQAIACRGLRRQPSPHFLATFDWHTVVERIVL